MVLLGVVGAAVGTTWSGGGLQLLIIGLVGAAASKRRDDGGSSWYHEIFEFKNFFFVFGLLENSKTI